LGESINNIGVNYLNIGVNYFPDCCLAVPGWERWKYSGHGGKTTNEQMAAIINN
jgi:hypothetical protein